MSAPSDLEFVPAPAEDAAPQTNLSAAGMSYGAPPPRAVSVAGPIPDPPASDAEPEFVPADDHSEPAFLPPIIAHSLFKTGVTDKLNSEPSDQGFDDAVRLNMGDLKWPLMAFKGVTPDVAAKVDQLAKSNGIPYSLADAGKEDLGVLQQAREIYNSLSATDEQGRFIYPNTRAWLSDPVNMAKSRDDLDALKGIEDAVRAKDQAGESAWFQTARAGASGIEKSLGSLFSIPGIVNNWDRNALDTLNNDGGPLGQIYRGVTGGGLPTTGAYAENPDWLNTFFGLTRYINQHADANDAATTQGRSTVGDLEQGHFAGAAQMAVAGLATFIPTIAASIADPALGVTEAAGTSGASQYQADIDAGTDPAKATQDAILNAGVNAAGVGTFGAVGQMARMKTLFAAPLARESANAMIGRIVKQSAISAGQGAVAQGGIQLGTDAAHAVTTGDPDAYKNEAEKVVNSAILGFIADGTMAAPLGALQGLRQIRQQEAGASWWSNLTQSVEQSKLLKRDPDALAEVITQNLTAAGKPTTVGVDADKLTTFFQDRPPGELNQFASDMALKPQDIANAASTGGAVDLPVGPYQAKYAGSELDKAIMRDIRFTPDGLSANELADQIAHVKQLGASISDELAKTVSGEGNQLPQQIRTMRDTLMADKADGGMGYTADQADSQLAVLLAGIKHSVARPGENVSQAVARLGLALKTGGEAPPENPQARGAIEFGDGSTTIQLFKNADFSTFAHESAHLFLDQRQKLIDAGLATPQAVADHAALLAHVGVQPGERPTTEQTEKLASNFEAYLREGKAPSVELSGPFARFRSWLTNVYRSIASLGVQPTDEVRQVFDRMLASEDDISHAQEYYSRKGEVLDLIKADEKDKQPVRAALAKVQQTELDKQTRAYLKSYLQAVGGVAAIRASAKEAVENQPIYKALETAKDGKINEESLRQAIGAQGLAEFTAKFPNLVKSDGARTVESLAAAHGFESPQTLADNLMASVPKDEAVTNYTRRLVAEKEAQIRDEIVKKGATPADSVMHTEGSLAYLIAETNLMAKQLAKGKSVRIDAAVFRDAAKQAIADMPVKKAVRYSDFARTEARLAKRVLDLARRGQWEDSAPDRDGKIVEGALTTRRKQIAQHAMVQEAIKARDERADIVRRYSPSRLESKLKNVDADYVDPVRQILSSYGLSDKTPTTPYDLKNLEGLDPVLYSQTPTWIINGENKGDYQNLTWGQLQDVDNAAKGVMTFGGDQRKSDLASKAKTMAELRDEAVKELNTLPSRKVRQLDGSAIGDRITKAGQFLDGAHFGLLKDQFIFRAFDGYKDGIHTKLFGAMRDAESRQSAAQEAVHDLAHVHMETLMDATKRLRKQLGSRFEVPGVKKPDIYSTKGLENWSPEELVAYMLNTGAAENVAVLRNSYGHGTAEFDRVAQLFSPKELHALDDLRDAVGTLYDGLDATTRKIYGRGTEKVEALPQDLTANDGSPVHLKGGYWPLAFDYSANRLQGKMSDEDVLRQETRSFMRTAKPEDGMTKSRVSGHSLAPRLEMGVFAKHVDDTTRFIHMAPLLHDMNRLMQDPVWRATVLDKFGINAYNEVTSWLKYQANPGREVTNPTMSAIDKWVRSARMAGTKSALGLNVGLYFKWRTASLNAIKELGGIRHLFNGYKAMGVGGMGTSIGGFSNTKAFADILAKTSYLRAREEKGIRGIENDVEGLRWDRYDVTIPGTSIKMDPRAWTDAIYALSRAGDRTVVAPAWVGGYLKYLAEIAGPNETPEEREKNAVAYADNVIQRSQPSMLNVDLSALQRDQSEFTKLFTMFMSYPLTLYGRATYHLAGLQAGRISKSDYAAHVALELIAEPMTRIAISALLLGGLPTATKLALAPVENVVDMIPGISNLWRLIVSGGDWGEVSPAADIGKKGTNLANDIKRRSDMSVVAWDVARLAGYLTGRPELNIVHTLLSFIAKSNHEKNPYK